jgi:hypothetical protein
MARSAQAGSGFVVAECTFLPNLTFVGKLMLDLEQVIPGLLQVNYCIVQGTGGLFIAHKMERLWKVKQGTFHA